MKQINTYLLIIVIFFSFLRNSNAQINYKKADSISFALYDNKKWQELIDFNNEIKLENFDFYLLNLRLGIAYYNIKNYKTSITYFTKALKNNSTSTVAKEYLYWNYLQLNKPEIAKTYYEELDDKTKKKITKSLLNPIKLFDFIYVEAGQNYIENKPETIENIRYFNIGLNHLISSKLSFYHAYYYQDQTLEFNDYQVNRYYAKPKYSLKNNIEIDLTFNYLTLKNKINFSENISQQTIEENVLLSDGFIYDRISTINQTNSNIGVVNQKEIQANIKFTKLYKKLKVGLFGGISNKKTKTNTTSTIDGTENIILIFEGNEVLNEDFPYQEENLIQQDSTTVKYNFGVIIGYDLTPKIGLSIETNSLFLDVNNTFNFMATTTYKLSKKINFALSYIQKGELEYYYDNNAYLINNLDKTTRFNFVSNFKISKKIDLYLVYQRDKIEDNILQQQINSNTFIIGLKLKL